MSTLEMVSNGTVLFGLAGPGRKWANSIAMMMPTTNLSILIDLFMLLLW